VDPRAGLDGCGILFPDGPARSEPLYWLSYVGPHHIETLVRQMLFRYVTKMGIRAVESA